MGFEVAITQRSQHFDDFVKTKSNESSFAIYLLIVCSKKKKINKHFKAVFQRFRGTFLISFSATFPTASTQFHSTISEWIYRHCGCSLFFITSHERVSYLHLKGFSILLSDVFPGTFNLPTRREVID